MTALSIGLRIGPHPLGPIAQGIATLRKYGANAHLWLPGIGSFNGIDLGNYLDSAGTTVATVDNPVGLVKDLISAGAINASQATTANKPTLRRGVTNLQTYSGSLTNAIWSPSGLSVATGQPDPFGGTSAFGLVDTAANTVHTLQSTVSYSFTAGTPYTQAVVVKAGSRRYIQVPFINTAFTGNSYANFDLQTGVVTAQSGVTTASIVPLGNGYYLCAATAVANVSTTGPQSYFWLAGSATDPFAPPYLGNATTAIYAYAAGQFVGTLTAAQILAAGGIPLTTTIAASSSGGELGVAVQQCEQPVFANHKCNRGIRLPWGLLHRVSLAVSRPCGLDKHRQFVGRRRVQVSK